MLRKMTDEIHWLEFEQLQEFSQLTHAIFLRHGGHSLSPYHSLNLGSFVNDDPNHVALNLKKIKNIFNLPKFICPKQCHGKKIIEIDPIHDGMTIECDALATKHLGIGLMITHADCQAAIFYDPINHAIANVHAGWRGSVQNIYAETIQFMQSKYGSQPKELLVCISPSLGPNDAEFINYRTELPEMFWEFQIKPNYFNFWEISKYQLQACGILPSHIEIAAISTYANPHDFFSYRYNQNTGRHGCMIALK